MAIYKINNIEVTKEEFHNTCFSVAPSSFTATISTPLTHIATINMSEDSKETRQEKLKSGLEKSINLENLTHEELKNIAFKSCGEFYIEESIKDAVSFISTKDILNYLKNVQNIPPHKFYIFKEAIKRKMTEGYSTRHKAAGLNKDSRPTQAQNLNNCQNIPTTAKQESDERYKEFCIMHEGINHGLKNLIVFKDHEITPKANEQERKVLEDWENDGELGFKKKESVGVKQNSGKLPMDKMISIQFPKALEAVCKATLFGHNKYKETDIDFLNFKRVEGGSQTYADALQRHNLNKVQTDDESGLPHIYHKCWNALAELELWIEENEKQK